MLPIPVLANTFIVLKALYTDILSSSSLQIVGIVSVSILLITFILVLLYSLKFFNVEVPNEDLVWSHNQKGGAYLPLTYQIILSS